jgi:hypothetical protein
MYLEIDDKKQEIKSSFSLHISNEFSIRFVEIKGLAYPILYYKGKRVTKKWKFLMDWVNLPDPYGSNANISCEDVL